MQTRSSALWELVKDVAFHTARLGVVLGGHILMAAILLASIFAIEKLFDWFWPLEGLMLFGHWKAKYLFHVMDLFVIGLFIVSGVREVFAVFRSRK
ncbi:hypothetical protein [Roseomonas sp. AR75]|uniref:hypothetical protein n=1 Tax=Roseomonas sp. AR75 TaxID=2562311 RepID=UPI0010C0E0E4|nr:hypothetical protein [Roseomonas sp. AR75]